MGYQWPHGLEQPSSDEGLCKDSETTDRTKSIVFVSTTQREGERKEL